MPLTFSNKFKTYHTISFENINHYIKLYENQEIICLDFNNNKKKSSGIFFPIFYVKPNIEEKKYKCKLIFDVKIEKLNKESFLKIYTGIEYITINKQLTNNFKTIEFVGFFDFSKSSTYRIGFINIEINSLYLKNVNLIFI